MTAASERAALEERLDQVTAQLREAWAGLIQIAALGSDKAGAAHVASVTIAAVEKAGGKPAQGTRDKIFEMTIDGLETVTAQRDEARDVVRDMREALCAEAGRQEGLAARDQQAAAKHGDSMTAIIHGERAEFRREFAARLRKLAGHENPS